MRGQAKVSSTRDRRASGGRGWASIVCGFLTSSSVRVASVVPHHEVARSPPESCWQYELQAVKPLASIDLTNTLVERLGARWQSRIHALMVKHYKNLAIAHRIASFSFILQLILPQSAFLHVVTVLVFGSLFALSCTMMFLSLDLLKMLLRTPDVLFVGFLSFINWSCLALLLGDARALICIPTMCATKIGLFMDANFRTYPTVLRSIVFSILAVLAIALFCAFDVVDHPHRRFVKIAGNTLSLANIISYTSMTIAIFVGKKAYFKHKGTSTDVAGFHSIKCVMLRAKMKLSLVPVGSQHQHQREPSCHIASVQSATNLQQEPHIQKLRLLKSSLLTIDATKSYLPVMFRPCRDQDLGRPPSWWYLIPLYATGLVGFLGLLAQFSLRLLPPSNLVDSLCHALASVSIVASATFCTAVAMHFQRDLVAQVVVSFDFLFASTQVIVTAVCVSDLTAWDASVSLTMFTWMLWFLWMFLLDALSPVMRQRLRFHKRMVITLQLMLLFAVLWISIEIFWGDVFVDGNRLLIEYRFSAKQKYRLTTISILVERLVTILGWFGPRIVADMLFADHDELLFLRGMIEYMSPYEIFPPRATQVQPPPAT